MVSFVGDVDEGNDDKEVDGDYGLMGFDGGGGGRGRGR